MSNLTSAVVQQLAACNGGPGLTDAELAARLGCQPAVMRTALAGMVFAKDGGITCVAASPRAEARYVLGDSAALRRVSA